MSILTAIELAKLRRDLVAELGAPVPGRVKPDYNAMLQAIENSLATGGSAASAINTAIENAAAGLFNGAQKTAATKVLLRFRGV